MHALVDHQLTLGDCFNILVICTNILWKDIFNNFIYLFIFGCAGPLSVTSLTVEPRLSGTWALGVVARGLSSGSSQALEQGSTAMAHGLSFSVACGILPDQGLNPCLLH